MKKILIVDDEESVRQLLEFQLKERYFVMLAKNGKMAVETAYAELPDLIIMDIMMPEMDGAEAAHHLEKSPRTSDIPILFLSSLAEGIPSTQMGSSVNYRLLAKPFDKDKLYKMIDQMLNEKEKI